MNDRILWDIIDGLRDEVNIAQDGITDLNDVVKDLQAEAIEQIKDNKKLQAEIKKLKDKLQAVNDDYNNDSKVHNEYADGLLAEIKDKDEALKGFREDYAKLNAELDTSNQLAEDLSVGGGIPIDANTTKHYPKEYKQEADEYFGHNPHCDKLFFFMIEGNEFDEDGDYNGSLYADDCIAEVDNV
jgi:predicted RNase H-like nuclease (RuvC/YqgF family)